MPRGIPKNKEDKVETNIILDKLTPLIENLAQTIGKIDERLNILERINEKPQKPLETDRPPIPVVKTTTPESKMTQLPIPSDYRDIVNDILNEEFQIEMEAYPDRPMFTFTIIVPDKYSNMPENEKALFHSDRRSCVISYADGLNKVREWTNKVFNNFDTETKAKIKLYSPSNDAA